jgi:hypothetical protein
MNCQLDERDPNTFGSNTSQIAAAAAIKAAANRQIISPTQAPFVVATPALTLSPTAAPFQSSSTLFLTDAPSTEYPTTFTSSQTNFTNTRSSIIDDTSQSSSGSQKLIPIVPAFFLLILTCLRL